MIFLHTSFPDEPEEDKDGGLSDDALGELSDGFDDDEDDFEHDDDEDRVAYDLHDDVDEF